MTDLQGKRILVTGWRGFVGRRLEKELERIPGVSINLTAVNLEQKCETYSLIRSYQPELVFHLAGHNGGISANQGAPADIFYKNTVMALNVLDACRQSGVEKVLSMVTSCAYADAAGPYLHKERGVMWEEEFFDGQPHDSVACHGYAKRNVQLGSVFFRQQFGLNAVCVCPPTVYGPGDRYDEGRSKVVAALIKKFCDAADSGEAEVTCWGTGRPLREVIYVDDCVSLLIQAMARYDNSALPLNLASGQEYHVKEMAEIIAARVGYNGAIVWDTSKPDGQYRKRLDPSRMHAVLGKDQRFTPFEQGIDLAAADYRSRRDAAND